MHILHGYVAHILTAPQWYYGSHQHPTTYHVPYIPPLYMVYICIKSLLYKRSISQMSPMQGAHYTACTLHAWGMYPVSRVHVSYMRSAIVSNAWYTTWYVWYIYYVCVVYCIHVCGMHLLCILYINKLFIQLFILYSRYQFIH